MEPELRLIEIGATIADGTPVDWGVAASEPAIASDPGLLNVLRLIERIAQVHASAPSLAVLGPSQVSTRDSAEGGQVFHDAPATWGSLTILELIGCGTFGDVYRARDPHLDRPVALKLLRQRDQHPETLGTTVIQEGRLLARVRHPNVVTVYGAERIGDQVGLWMEFIDGWTLERELRTKGPFSVADVVSIGLDVCRALAAVHQAGLLHRDVKAQNVMRERTGRVVLTDFGTGRELSNADDTSAQELAGTPLYLAPELFAEHQATVESDVYSVGVLLYHLLTGTYPVTGRTVRELRERHRVASRAAVREISADVPTVLARVIDRALDVDPTHRFRSADEMADSLAASAPVTTMPRYRKTAWGVPLSAAGSVIVIATILLSFNIGGSRDRMFGRPIPPVGPAALTDQFGVREVLKSGEYFDFGRPSADGRYFPLLDRETSDVVVKDLRTGERRRLTKGSDAEGYTDGAPAVSPDDQWVAYPWKTPDGQSELRVVGLTGRAESNSPRVLFRRVGVEPSVREWSGDGTELLTVFARNNGTTQIALVSTADGSARLIKDLGVFPALGVSLSPDGRFVAYDRPQKSDPRMRDLFVVATDGTGEWPLVQHPAGDMFPFWMADGGRVLFTSDRTGALGLWMIRVADGRPVDDPEVVNRDMGRMTPIGPTNTGAFFYRFETGLVDVYTASLDASSQTVIGKPQSVLPNHVGSNISSDWSVDGRHLAYVKIRNPAGAAQADLFSRALAIRDAESGKERDLFPPLAFFIAPRWAPDGRTILVQGVDVNRRMGIQRVDVATAQLRPAPIPNLGAGGVGWPRFTPDGRSLLYSRNGSQVISRDLASGRDTTLLDLRATGLDHFSPGPIGTPFGMSSTGQLGFSAWTGWGKKASTVIEVVPPGAPAIELLRTGGQEPVIFQGWTPDGLNILFTRTASVAPGEQSTALWRIPAAGGEPLRAGLEMVGLRDVHLDTTGTRLTFTAGWQTGDVRVMEHFLSP